MATKKKLDLFRVLPWALIGVQFWWWNKKAPQVLNLGSGGGYGKKSSPAPNPSSADEPVAFAAEGTSQRTGSTQQFVDTIGQVAPRRAS